eukprot:512135_1
MVGKWKLSFMDDEYMAHEFLNVFNQSIGDTEENDESSTFNSMNAQTAASWANGFKQNDANATETAGGSFANIKWNFTSKEVETQAQEDNEITDDTLDIFRISGRKGVNSTPINGDFCEQNGKHNEMLYYKKKEDNEMLFYSDCSRWTSSSAFDSDRMKAASSEKNIEDVSEWKVYEGKEKGYVLDTNIKIQKLSISKALYESVGCNVCVKDILDKSNEDILIFKEAIKIAAYWKVVMKRVIDIIPMLV